MEASIQRLQTLLIDTEDDAKRARVHLELGQRALSDKRPDLAIRHLREALLLDRGLERARELLAPLTRGGSDRPSKRRSMVRSLVGLLRSDPLNG